MILAFLRNAEAKRGTPSMFDLIEQEDEEAEDMREGA